MQNKDQKRKRLLRKLRGRGELTIIDSPGKARVALKSGSSIAILENGDSLKLLKELEKLTISWPKHEDN